LDVDEDKREKLRALARQKVQLLMAGPKLTALSPGEDKSWFDRPPVSENSLAARPPSDGRPDLSQIRAIVEEVLDGGDIRVTTKDSVASLVMASREMGEDVLADILAKLPAKRCGSLRDYGTYLSKGILTPEAWDWQFLVGHMQIQKLGAGLRARPEHSLEDIATILNKHDEVVFTTPGRLRAAVEQARQEKFSSLEQLFADMLEEQALSVAGLALAVQQPEFCGLRHRSTAEFLMVVAPGVGSADDLMPLARAEKAGPPAVKKSKTTGYVYVMSDPGTTGLLKIGQTMNHPEVRLHQLNKETSRVYPLELVEFWECDNPPAIEHKLHEAFSHCRITQSREFFATDVETVRQAVRRILG
jgi:hypothetical protein